MKLLKRLSKKGISLVEMLVVLAIIGIAIFIFRVVIDMVNAFFQNSTQAQVQRDVQSTLFTITKDIRNCRNIVSVSSDTIVMRMNDTAGGFDASTNPDLFDLTKLSTMTYQYLQDGADTYVKRTIERFNKPTDEKLLMRNILVRPEAPDYIFSGCTETDFLTSNQCSGLSNNPRGVDIRLTVSPLYIKNSQRTYSSRAIRRSK